MRFLIQVVDSASVSVDGRVVSSTGSGYLVLAGFCHGDTKERCDKMVRKLLDLRILKDGDGKANLSIKDTGGQILCISQFTLYADCKHGNRPSFTDSMGYDEANELYGYTLESLRRSGLTVGEGVFGEHMIVSLVNNGPFTVMLDSEQMKGF